MIKPIHSCFHAASVACLTLMYAGMLTAQNTWTVSNNPSFNADFSNIQTAINAVDPGDKIYVHGSPNTYPSFDVTKRIHLIGPGFWKTENSIMDENQYQAFVTGNDVQPSIDILADSVIVEGFRPQWMAIRANDAVVRYNQICCYPGSGHFGQIVFYDSPVNLMIYGNYISNGLEGSAVNANVFNNIIIKGSGPSGNNELWPVNTSNIDCIVQNNAIGYSGSSASVIGNCTFRNNIVDYATFSMTGALTIENNLFTDDMVNVNGTPIDSLGNGNLDSVIISTIWNYSNPSPDGKYQLIGDSTTNVAYGAGINGEDCGAFGGDSPYRLSGIVRVPTIYNMLIPVVGDTTNMLKVKIKAKSN